MKYRRQLRQRWVMNASLGAVCSLSLAACNGVPPPQVLTKFQVQRVIVPAALLDIPDEPTIPASRMQSAAADYIVHLKINDDECHVDIGAIAASQK